MTGGSSYIITLPKDWVKTMNIGKNDPIGLLQQSDGTLLVTPKIDKEPIKKQHTFIVENGKNEEFLFRELIGAYISGYNSIKVVCKPRMRPPIRKTIRKYIQTTIGQEVVEETDSTITIKDLLNPSEMPFHRTIKRMHIIIKSMYEDAIKSLVEGDKQLAKDVLTRDAEIDRLHWLIARQHHIIQHNISFVEKMKITVDTATTSYLISRIIERIGDHVNKIAYHISILIDKNIKETIILKIDEAKNESLGLLNKGIGSFTKREINEANETIEGSTQLTKICEELDTLALHYDAPSAISIGYIVDSIRRIADYTEDISESVINHLIGEGK
jgi:phosphate uptake regulator